MSEQTDFSALEWVKGEISDSLRQAQHALEAYVANPKDSTKMQFCITHLHQVWGTLKMVELEGATLFASEMEALAQSIADKKVPKVSEAQEVLMQAFLQLPTYLDNLTSGSKDSPVVLLPMLNDLRSTRGESLMSETVMFSPDLASGNKVAAQREDSKVTDLEKELQKVRKAYQKSLLAVLQGEAMEKNLDYMGKVLGHLQKLSGKSEISQIWWIGGALIDGLLNGSIEFSKSVTSLLSALDRQIKEMVDDNAKVLKEKAPVQLAKNLLYYVAGSDASTKRIMNVQKAYKLERALPKEVREEQSQQARRGLVNEAIVAAVDVLIEDLLNINEVLDLVVRNKGKEDGRLKELLPIVKSIAGALHVLALKDARNIMAAQYKILGACVAGKVDDVKSELMSVAGQLLAVESTLNDIAKNGLSGKILIGEISNKEKVSSDQLGVAQRALLNEAVTSLETVKELFGTILAADAQWDHAVLEEITQNLKILSGSLKIIPLPLASEILDKSANYVNDKLLSVTQAPEQKELETFADVLSSVDYYLEKLRTDSRSDERALSIGTARLEALGFGLQNAEKLTVVTATVVEDKEEEEGLTEILERDDEAQIKAEAEIAEKEKTAELEAIEKEADEAESLAPIETVEQAEEEPVAEVEAQVESKTEETGGAAASDDDDNVIDDEIIEIFIEEVGDVQETLKEFLPQWTANTSDNESMTEVRRAFHTLKGSGRMVGATEMGEMAWCVENMLNRVIDNTIKVNDVLLQTVLDAVDTVPELLELFKQARNESTPRSNEISERANRIANGETVSLSDTVSAETSVTETQEASEETDQEELVAELPAVDVEAEAEEAPEYDMEIVEIFSQEALGHTENLLNFVAECREKSGPWVISDDVLRVMHTLKGCANMADIQPVAPVVTKAENFVKELRLLDKKANDDVINIIEKASLLTNRVIEELPAISKESKDIANEALATLENLSETLLTGEGGDIDGDAGKQQRIDLFLTFAFDAIFDGEDWLAEYLESANDEDARKANHENLNTLADECSQIAELAVQCELDEIGDLSKAIQQSCLVAQQQNIPEAFVTDVSKAVNRLAEIVDFMAAGQFIKSPAKLTALVNEHLSAYPVPDLAVEAPQQPEHIDAPEEASLEVEDIGEIPLPAVQDDEVETAELLEPIEVEEAFDAPPLAQVDEEETPEVAEETIEATLPEPEPEPEPEPVAAAEIELRMDDDIERDEEIVGIFLEEAEELIENSANLLEQWQDSPSDFSIVAELQRDLHTLKGGARMAEFASIGDLGHELENIYEGVGSGQISTTPELFNLLFRCHDRISEMFSDIRDQGNCYRADDLLNEISLLVSGKSITSSLDVADVEETVEQVEEIAEVPEVTQEPEPQEVIEVQEDLVELEAISTDSDLSESDDEEVSEELSAEEAKRLLDAGDDSELDVELELVEIFLEEAEEIIESSSNALEEWRADTSNQGLVEQLQRELHTLKGGARMAQISEIGDFAHEMENIYEGIVGGTVDKSEALINLLLVCHDRLNEMVTSLKENNQCEAAEDLVEQLKLALQGRLGEQVPAKAEKKSTSEAIKLEADIAPDVIELFLNDGVEMLDQLDKALLTLASSSDKKDAANVKEALATLSGGAKLSGFKSLGSYCDSFAKKVDAQIKKGFDQQELAESFTQIKDFIDLLAKEKPAQTKQKESKPAAVAKKAPEKKAAAKSTDDNKQKEQESIKISADLLENLVNLAGETSINRGRLEVQLSDFAFTIDEMTDTIERLQEQLRRLHLETEAQIVSRYEKEGPSEEEMAAIEAMEEDDDFDPLEMDKYSAIDQLSRSLSESASDLIDLKDTLIFKTRDAETLLIQQARVNTELQEGLMRSRMVPFSRILPRLRRIVRQVGNELKKPVDLELLNAEGELDRAVLEKMISPIEHMLRNSIAHGIESPDGRKNAGKPKNGTISIDIGREGSNMFIKVKDDGAGVNVAAVRKKAIENGLLDPKADLPDDEIVEFIFNPGFSTASEVSQVAGRGVGMDVVASEIKALNGSIETHSVTGTGTTFTVRLPFTVAVNRALMVSIGEALFAIPLTSIEGVVRVSPYELEAYYEEEESIFNYAGVDYQLQYLGAYMHGNEKPHLIGQSRPLPVLLVQSSDHAVAMQVDSLLGSREIVVKSVGPQLSTVAGLSGATILGDGSVVIILDIHSMIRGAIAQKQSEDVQAGAIEARKEDRPTMVMVVDDSVTVRKVTSRLLERNGMEVVLAKDGVDAITQLQDVKPDVMLLDIEMPRMDGFEVATLVRHDERLQDLPIIMITSRTGEKHKQRAMDIGVNRYMGKPFQENQLLQTIEELITETQGAKV